MYIDEGANVNAAWTKQIAVSPNGADWETIQKEAIATVTPTFIPNIAASVANRGYGYQDMARIRIKYHNESEWFFDVQEVKNQAGWIKPGAATVRDGLNKAVEDITTWLST